MGQGAEDSGHVACCECDRQLLRFVERVTRHWDHILVQCFKDALKGSKLNHGVRDLPHPQRGQSLVEPGEREREMNTWESGTCGTLVCD